MFSSSQALHTSVWLKEWRQCMDAGDAAREVPPALRSRLLDPLRAGDPVFATMLCRELLGEPSNIESAVRVLCVPPQKCPARVLMCEVLFYVCKGTAAECRSVVVHLVPALLYAEWVLSCAAARGASVDEDLAAVEVAVLAAYQQDYSVSPMPPVLRVPSLSVPSIYHAGADEIHLDFGAAFESEAKLSAQLYPTGSVRMDSHSRKAITHRLCRAVQDSLAEMHMQSVLVYALVILVFVGAREQSVSAFRSRLAAAATMCAENAVDGASDREFPVRTPLLLLWAQALSVLRTRLPETEIRLRALLRSASVSLASPAAILALRA